MTFGLAHARSHNKAFCLHNIDHPSRYKNCTFLFYKEIAFSLDDLWIAFDPRLSLLYRNLHFYALTN